MNVENNNRPRPLHADMMIKVCGMREPENISQVASLTPMLMGFIFHPQSPRDASSLDPSVVKSLPRFIRPVAVFVDRTEDEIIATTQRYGIKIIQLHGDESPSLCKALRDKGYIVFKAVNIASPDDFDKVEAYKDCCDLFLFDTKTALRGGSGQKFDWSLLDCYTLDVPFLLSGGIGPDDVDAIIQAMRPGMAGIDINSRFETEPGHKDISKLINFILSLRKYNEHEPSETPFWEKTK